MKSKIKIVIKMIRALFILIILTTTTLSCFSQTEDKRDKNQKYLDANTTGIKIFNNRELLTKKMVEILEAKEHTYRTVFDDTISSVNESSSQISELSSYQNKVIYLMLIRLKDTAFVNVMGQTIKEDVEDITSEHGGIIRFNKDGKIFLRCSKSNSDFQEGEDNNNLYYLSQKEDSLSKIGYFHFHAATYNETPYAAPGALDMMHASYPNKCNMVNEFVITSLRKGKFNIDYYGMDIRAGEVGLLYEGEDVKVIDLGNYNYR